GDALGPLLKGPLTPTAEIAFESFFGIYLVGNLVAARLYDRHPALMIPNEQGVPEPPQRVHWDNAFTQRLLGLPGAYDLGPERCAEACVRRGQALSRGLPFGPDGPQIGQGGRTNPVHTMTAIDGRLGADPDGPRYADDTVSMPLQCATQWDSLAHVYYDGRLYNGVPASTLGAAGATRNAIDNLARGIVSRGVLLDLARARGVERLRAGEVIAPADLEAAERAEGVRAERGDVLLLRTGHLAVVTRD